MGWVSRRHSYDAVLGQLSPLALAMVMNLSHHLSRRNRADYLVPAGLFPY